MKKPISCQIKKKKFYLYKITWIDITGEEDHANPEQFDNMNYSTLITYGFLYSRNSKMLKTFSTYDVDDEVFSGRNVFPIGCIKKLEKVFV
jgi:hypothetical protein|tara:strand:+ start:129 stop:401 length:273 start_codon:yes stop_codon:yes gene_type:complete